MPKVQVEIRRTVTITRDESAVVELDIPQDVIDDCGEYDWLTDIMDKDDDGTLTETDKSVYAAVTGAEWDHDDEDESVEYAEVLA